MFGDALIMLLALACILVMDEGKGEVCPEVNLVNAVFLDCLAAVGT